MVSFFRNLFGNKKPVNKQSNYEYVETKYDKIKDTKSDMFIYLTEEYYKDNNDIKGNKRITIATILVPDHVTFEEAKSKSISYTVDKDKFKYSYHMDARSESEGTRTGIYTLNCNDGSYISSSLTHSWDNKGKRTILLSDVYPELKQKPQGSSDKQINTHSDKKSDVISNIGTSTSIEPALVIMLGPPSDNEQKIMFEKYQEGFHNNNVENYKDWENFEKYMLNKLFSKTNNQPSRIEELFFLLLKVPIKIDDYTFSFGNHKNKWVAGFSIPSSAVRFGNIPNMKWPPKKEIMDTAADALGLALQREWVFVYSVIPPKENNASAEGLHK